MSRKSRSTFYANSLLLLQSLRPAQWTKNTVLFAAFAFGYGDRSQYIPWEAALLLIPAFVLFCAASSSVYLFNDLLDRTSDQSHPDKRHRPIASGRLPARTAGITATGLLAVTLALSAWLSYPFFQIILLYLGLQLLYSTLLKRVALLDVFTIAVGFVLRAISGAVLLAIPISPWLLLCTFLLALFLALCKRRHEKGSIEAAAGARQRISLQKYDLRLTDQLISIVAAATVVSYAIYTLWPETIAKFGSARLGYTVPLVMFGLFRYLDLLYRENKGDRPEKVLLTDIPILATLTLYALLVLYIFTTQSTL